MATKAIRIIRLCRECAHYNEKDDTCKVLSVVNHAIMDVTQIKSLHCRTREDLCGMEARYYEPSQAQTVQPVPVMENTKTTDETTEDNSTTLQLTYYIDGSVNVCGAGCNVDSYYDNLHHDFNDVY